MSRRLRANEHPRSFSADGNAARPVVASQQRCVICHNNSAYRTSHVTKLNDTPSAVFCTRTGTRGTGDCVAISPEPSDVAPRESAQGGHGFPDGHLTRMPVLFVVMTIEGPPPGRASRASRVRSGSRDHLDDFYLGSKVKVLKECEQERQRFTTLLGYQNGNDRVIAS
jgi:hypothetical protein